MSTGTAAAISGAYGTLSIQLFAGGAAARSGATGTLSLGRAVALAGVIAGSTATLAPTATFTPPSTQRWRFDDPTDLSSYVFATNPNKGGPATAKKNLTEQPTAAADGTPIVFEGEDDVMTGQISGVLLSQNQYDQFKAWFNKRHPFKLTDDLGRQSMVVLTKFTPKREGTAHYRYRQTYTIDYLIMEQINP